MPSCIYGCTRGCDTGCPFWKADGGKPSPRTPGKEHPKPNLPGPYPPNNG